MTSFLYFGLGLQQGFFQSDGRELSVERISPPVATTEMAAGDIDYTAVFGITVRSAAKGLPVKVVAALMNRPNWFLMAKPEIRSARDLKGKTIAITAVGGPSNTLWRSG